MDKLPGLSINKGITRRFGGPNGYGHQWDGFHMKTPASVLARKLGWSTSGGPADLRPAVLDPNGPGILDQLTTSSCVGHAHVGAIMVRLLLMGIPAPYLLSPLCAYDLARIIDRVPINGFFQPMTDEGSMPNACIRGVGEFGICSFARRPTDPARVNDEPNMAELEQGFKIRPLGIYEIMGTGQTREDQIQAALRAGYPVTIATIVDPAFEDWTGGDPIGAPDVTRALGGHNIYLVAYEVLSNGQVVYWIANSWNKTWGVQGFGLVSSDWIQSATDLEIVQLDTMPEAA